MSHSLLNLIGNTPLVKSRSLNPNKKVSLYFKMEGHNPGGSVKDRAAYNMIKSGLERGEIIRETPLIEATSGNTGIALAMIAGSYGLNIELIMPENATRERVQTMRAYGAKVILTPADAGIEGARDYAENKVKEEGYFMLNQFGNPDNWKAHYTSTGPEIWKDTEGKVTHFVSAMGTTGTIMGTSTYLKEQNPDVQIIGIDAYGSVLKKYHETGQFDKEEIYPYRIEGLGKNLIPTATDFDIIDRFEKVTDEDSAHVAREIATTEGLFVGYTSGAAMQGVRQLAEEGVFGPDSVVVVIFPDHGSRYMSKIYSDEWMKQQGFADVDSETLEPTQVVK